MHQSALAVPTYCPATQEPTIVVATPILEVAALLARQWKAGALLGNDHVFDDTGWPLPAYYQQRGFHRWCSGGDRVVLFHDSGWCLKAPLGPGYERANRKELLILDEVGAAERQLFAETHSLPGDILLQREYRIDPARFLQVEATCADLRRAQWRLRIMDIHQYNVGWRADGGWVFIDWAGVCRPRRLIAHAE